MMISRFYLNFAISITRGSVAVAGTFPLSSISGGVCALNGVLSSSYSPCWANEFAKFCISDSPSMSPEAANILPLARFLCCRPALSFRSASRISHVETLLAQTNHPGQMKDFRPAPTVCAQNAREEVRLQSTRRTNMGPFWY